MSKFKILISDDLSIAGVDILEKSGIFEVELHKKTSKEELIEIIQDFHGLIVRSASKVTRELIEKATNLKVVIRAGVGVDNIDISSCSQKGIVVMNAPAGNAISTAEQAIGLIFCLARNLPQANNSMKAKKWEKSKFKGNQLMGKILAVIGLGRIGKEVVKRARGIGMEVWGYDPYIPKKNLEHLQIKLTDLESIYKGSDFITVHTPLTKTTQGLINVNNYKDLKKGVKLINCARGGIYEEEALSLGLKSGHIGGVGLDVYSQEPLPENSPFYEFENCIMTPHIGASTDEAQIEVARETAMAMVEYFKNGVARNSLNFPTIDPEEMDFLTPWFSLCERVSNFAAQMVDHPLESVDVRFYGKLVNFNLGPLEIAITKGILKLAFGEEVNLVNAPILAKGRRLNVNTIKEQESDSEGNKGNADLFSISFQNSRETIEIRATINFLGGTIISINQIPVEFKPKGHILFIRNNDIPKVVGEIGLILGNAGINIAALQLGRDNKDGLAMTIIELDSEISSDTLKQLQEKDFIISIKYIFVS